MNLYVIPTYECNLNCKSCYARKFQVMFPDYLTWEQFICIYEKFKNNTNRFLFIGGEVTKWKFIDEAILFLKNKNKKVTIFSNAVKMVNTMPDNIIINGSNLFDNEHSGYIIKNIEAYKKNKVRVTLRFNINESFKNYIQESIEIAKKYADSVSLSVLYPINNYSKSIGELIYKIANELCSIFVPVKISRATPLCLFTSEQRKYLEVNCGLKGNCALPTNSIVINPDGKSIQPCVELSLLKDISCLSNSSPKILFEKEINDLCNKTKKDCINCDMYKNGICCGGCLSYK